MAFHFENLKDILVCPQSKARLVQEGETLVSVDPETRLQYDIKDDIPILLVEEARELPKTEWAAIMEKHGRNPETGEES